MNCIQWGIEIPSDRLALLAHTNRCVKCSVEKPRPGFMVLESVTAVNFLGDIGGWMRGHRPNQKVQRCEGAYFFYGDVQTPNDKVSDGGPVATGFK